MMLTTGMGPGMWLAMAAGTIGLWVVVTLLVRAIFSGHPGRGKPPWFPARCTCWPTDWPAARSASKSTSTDGAP